MRIKKVLVAEEGAKAAEPTIINKGVRLVGLGLCLGVACLFGAGQHLAHADTITFNLNPTGYYLNLTANPTLAMDISPNESGAIAAAKDTLSVATNMPAGYKLYLSMASATTDSNKLYRNGDNTKAFNPTTGTVASPVALTNNTWGFAIPNTTTGLPTNGFDAAYDATTPANSSKWANVPVKGSDVLIRSTNTPSPTTAPSTMDIYYGAKADLNLPSGVYSNTLTYSTVAEASQEVAGFASVSPSIVNNLAGGDTITITTSLYTQMDPGAVTVTIGGTACTNPAASIVNDVVTITCTTPAKAAGKYDVVATIPKFSKTYTITEGLEYAPPSFGITNMQDISSNLCASLPIGAQDTLTDTRDNKQYTVAKLADGKCWMTANLRLGNAEGGQPITLTSADSDVASNFTLQPSTGLVLWAGGHNDGPAVNSVKMYSNGDKWLSGNFSGGEMTVQDSGTPDTPSRYIGNYYNWHTATAGTGLYNNTTTDATSSICPKGWRLPTDGATGDFQSLYTALGNDAAKYKTSSSLALSGYYNYGGFIFDQGSYGYLWSSTPSSTAYNAYYLHVYTSSVSSQQHNSKAYGFSVRCIAR